MMKKSARDRNRSTSSDNYKLASVLFVLCFHLTALAIALLTQDAESAVTGSNDDGLCARTWRTNCLP